MLTYSGIMFLFIYPYWPGVFVVSGTSGASFKGTADCRTSEYLNQRLLHSVFLNSADYPMVALHGQKTQN